MDKCLCGGDRFTYLLKSEKFSILKCSGCGLCRTSPKPSPDYSGSDALPERDKSTELLARKFATEVIGHILRFKKSGTLLDIGSGRGMVLHVASQHGFEPLGVEISRSDAEYSRRFLGVKVITQDIFKAKLKQKFDVIVMNHFLEHIENPVEALKRIRDNLNDDGIIFIGLPNVDSAWRAIQKENWYPYQHKQHIWHFSPKTMANLLLSSGFRPLKIMKTGVEHSPIMMPLDFIFRKLGLGDNLAVIAAKR